MELIAHKLSAPVRLSINEVVVYSCCAYLFSVWPRPTATTGLNECLPTDVVNHKPGIELLMKFDHLYMLPYFHGEYGTINDVTRA